MHARSIGIVVPVASGDAAWRKLLPRLAPLRERCEVIIAGTRQRPDDMPSMPGMALQWIEADAGRACQQNAGARSVRGRLLWFLHADSLPDERAVASMLRLEPARFDALGWFHLRFHDGSGLHRLNALGANLRSRMLSLPFGDQGLVLPAAHFHSLGGFDQTLARGEDLDLVVRARHADMPLRRLDGAIATSARRYRTEGWLRTTATHLRLTRSLRREALARLDRSRR
jgi:hypothetical protein